MSLRAPAVFTIDPERPFVDALAQGILAQVGNAPEALARVRVLLPTRRACRSLREAFLRLSAGKALLLPQMTPLGDVDEDGLLLEGAEMDDALDLPPAIGGLERQLMLARFVLQRDQDQTPEQAAMLAAELARLVDQVHTEGLDLARLPDLVDRDDLAEHWQKTVTFLSIVGETWPNVLDAAGALDPAKRRDLLIRARAKAWRDHPPEGWIIAAGSTGSIPATAELLGVVARLPRGQVVLPGLDLFSSEAVWDALDATHPQYGMARLLAKLGVARDDVRAWPGNAERPHPRRALLDMALLPAETTELWRGFTPDAAALDGLTFVTCDGAREEAETIALILRSALEDQDENPGRTAALITPDRTLARRVQIEMRRWGVEVDDSAGLPLDQTSPGAFFTLVADMMLENFSPIATLACLKHPLAAGGMRPGDLRGCVRALEAACLRGARPNVGLAGLEERLRTFRRDTYAPEQFARMGFKTDQVTTMLKVLRERVDPLARALTSDNAMSPQALLRLHVQAAEALAQAKGAEDGADSQRLWTGEAGEALSGFIAEAFDALDVLPDIEPEHYPALMRALMTGRPVRPRYARHPRVFVWGLLEARLQKADVTVLGGLNEGTWPGEPDPSPWMSRPMMRRFGLPLPERRIGLAAHDFVQAAAGGRVFITRAKRQGTSPETPSRWLTRLETLLGDAAPKADVAWPAWAAALTRWDGKPQPGKPPQPRPPVSARPTKLSVTQVETWVRDPYAIYARHILGLEPLDPIDADASAADKGVVIHDALERFVKQVDTDIPELAFKRLMEIGEIVFRERISSPAVKALWWPRFERIAAWFVDLELKRREAGFRPWVLEQRAETVIDGFTLSAKADRLDKSPQGGVSVIDYKTGQVPTAPMVESGLSPQLPLEALIVKRGGFADIPKDTAIDSLLYVKLGGGRVEGEEKPLKLDVENVVQKAFEGLVKRIHTYADKKTPYLSRIRPRFEKDVGDYDHLARVKEWRAGNEGGES